jgi:hypothetical protein
MVRDLPLIFPYFSVSFAVRLFCQKTISFKNKDFEKKGLFVLKSGTKFSYIKFRKTHMNEHNRYKGINKMSRKILRTILALTALCMMVAAPLWGDENLPLSTEDLFKHISKENPYTNWSTWPGEGRRIKGDEHGAYVTRFVNDQARTAVTSGEDELPYGSIIVQENYTSWGLASISVMYKVARGYNPDANDWFFAMYTPRGTTREEGRSASCANCHQSAGSSDYMLGNARVK